MNAVSDLGIAGYILFWGVTALAVAIFLRRLSQLFRYLSLGRRDGRLDNPLLKLVLAIGHLIVQQCQLKNLTKKDRASLGHAFMVWGFLLFVTYYFFFIIVASGLGISDFMEHNAVYAIYTWVMDIIAPFIMLGALWGIIRRYIVKPPRLKGQQTAEALVILLTVLIHPITHIGKIATQIAAGHPPAGLGLVTPPLSTAFSALYANSLSVEAWHTFWFWSHWGFVLFVLVIIGYTRYLHVVAAVINDMLRAAPPKGMVAPINVNDPATFGASRIDGFTRKQILDLYACVEPGLCQEVCPATFTGKPLNPRLLIKNLKKNLLTNAPRLLKGKEPLIPLIGDVSDGSVSEEVIWECTTCGACMEVCPVYIEHVQHIIEMRRNLVQLQAKFPEELLNLFDNIEQRYNPWGIVPAERVKWAADITVKTFEAGKTEYLFFVGCAGAFDARNRKTTLALAKIFDAAGVSWGILGKDEKCCGDSLRRLGNEYVFDRMAKENVKLFADRGVKKIITQCPHCLTTLKNDYRQFGANLEVIHHTQFIDSLIQEGKLKVNGVKDLGATVFHDSCYLGRYNQIYEPPRRIFRSITGAPPLEMERRRERSFCCGAGGGRMWMEEAIGKHINVARVEEALTHSPQTLCVSCPYCMIMFEDGLKDLDAFEKVQVLDIAEIVAKGLP